MEKEGSPVSGKLSLRNSAKKNVNSNFFTGNNNNNYNNINNNNNNNENKSPFLRFDWENRQFQIEWLLKGSAMWRRRTKEGIWRHKSWLGWKEDPV